MQIVFSSEKSVDWGAVERQIEAAELGALQDAAKLAIAEGRANIAAAGFPARWQAALKSRVFPNKGGDPAALIFDTMPFAGVFERGAHIGGQPLLWLPIGDKAGVRSPRQYGGKLVSVNVRGKPPLLFDASNRELGPLFVGVRAVTIRKRFNLLSIFAKAAGKVAEFFEQRMKS